MPTRFWTANEARQIGDRLIALYHRHLIDCEVRVEFVFRDDVPKKLGKDILGTARKITSLNAFLAGEGLEEEQQGQPFFVICLSHPWWERLKEQQRMALIDHELCHCWAEFEVDELGDPTDEVKLTLLGHDVEEFGAIVRRYGLWKSDLKQFGQTVRDSDPQLDFSQVRN